MNTKIIFAVTALTTLAVSTFLTGVISKKAGKKEAVNHLRDEQLLQAKLEADAKFAALLTKGVLKVSSVEAVEIDDWLTAECAVINEMYDEILNTI